MDLTKVPRDELKAAVGDVITGVRDPEVLMIADKLEDDVVGLGKRGSVELLMRLGWWMQEAGL